MPSQHFSSLGNAANGVLEGKIRKPFFWEGKGEGVGAWRRTPQGSLRARIRGTGLALPFHTIGIEYYYKGAMVYNSPRPFRNSWIPPAERREQLQKISRNLKYIYATGRK